MKPDEKKTGQFNIRLMIVAGVILILFAAFIPVYSWFYYGRSGAGITKIVDPTAIFINAGNAEDIRYLNLSGIDVENVDPDHLYKDFVFCVRGTSVYQYKLQLAYTTNNQFEYEIYPAVLADDPSSVPANTLTEVDYTIHIGGSGVQKYYVPNGTSPLTGSFLNRQSTEEILAKTDDSLYTLTYTPDGSATTYDNRHKYAVPLYWQTDNPYTAVNVDGSDFCDYFVLRVIWTSGARNDKETDIIYISARNITT